MDQLTSDLLTNWGLINYVRSFCEGKVDAGTLRLLADDEINQLIPIPGDRARFKINLSNWKREINRLETPEIPQNSTPNLPTLSVTSSDLKSLGGDWTSLLGNEPIAIPLSSDVSSGERDLQGQQTPLTKHLLTAPPPDGPPERACPERSLNSRGPNDSDLELSGYVLKTLKSTLDGKSILSQGQSTGKLNETQRNLLVELLIQPLFESNQNRQFTYQELLEWSLQIQELFRLESAALYYTPYVTAHVRATARNASGKLLRFLYNRRRQLREKVIIPASSRSRSSSKSSSSTSAQGLKDLGGEDNDLEQLEGCIKISYN